VELSRRPAALGCFTVDDLSLLVRHVRRPFMHWSSLSALTCEEGASVSTSMPLGAVSLVSALICCRVV